MAGHLMVADAGLPSNLSHFFVGLRAGASRGAVAGAVLPEAVRGEPDDVGVDRDLDDGVAGAVVWPAGAAAEHAIVERAMAARRTAPAVGLAVDGRERIAKFSF